MKLFKVAVSILIFLIFTFGCLLATAEEVKIGYINLRKTFSEYEKTEESEKSLQKKLDKKEKEREKLVEEIRNLKDEIALLSDKGKGEKQSLIDEKIKNLQEFDTELRNELKQERDEMIRDIEREIGKIIEDYAEKGGYTVILNDLVAVYWDETIDITQDIIDILNKNHKKR